jgi:hypothetical protein
MSMADTLSSGTFIWKLTLTLIYSLPDGKFFAGIKLQLLVYQDAAQQEEI